MQRYQSIIERIARASGMTLPEIEKKVEAKKEKLSGLISREGAAQIIAAEMGISFEEQESKIAELLPGMKKVNLTGKITGLFPVREYEKNGKSGKVANFFIADETGSTRVVLWDMKHISMIEEGKLNLGNVIDIKNGNMRETEIHLGGFSEISLSDKTINVTITSTGNQNKQDTTLEEARAGQNIRVRGVIVQVFQPRFYQVCPECNKKVVSNEEQHTCAEHGKVIPKPRAILNLVVDDGTENMRVVMFGEQIKPFIAEEELVILEKATAFRDDMLGTEVYIEGPVKINKLFNNQEIIATNVKKVDVEELIEELGN